MMIQRLSKIIQGNKNLVISISLDISQSYTESFSKCTVERERKDRQTHLRSERSTIKMLNAHRKHKY